MTVHLVRPNGKAYRPRKPPSVELYTDMPDEVDAVVVLRTHDPVLARIVAADDLGALSLDPDVYELDWWRLIPWDASGYGFPSTWIHDPERGSPCVRFCTPLEGQ